MDTSTSVAPSVTEAKSSFQHVTEPKVGGLFERSQVVKNVGSVPLAAAEAKQKPSPWTKSMFKLYLVLLLPLFWGIGNAIQDGLGTINSFGQFRLYMGIDLEKGSPSTSFVALSRNIGFGLGVLVAAPIIDWKGRKWGIFIGGLIFAISSVVLAAAQNLSWWVAARVFAAFGWACMKNSQYIYTIEMIHPSFRGPSFGFLASFYLIGQIPGTFIPYATLKMASDWSWRIPVLATLFFPLIVLLYVPFVPESPRWLIANNRFHEAHAILTKYHGEDNPDSAIVQLELDEMNVDISSTGSDKHWWDYRDVLGTPENRRRFAQALAFTVIGQFAGNAAVTYYFPQMLKSVAITDLQTPLLINGIASPVQWLAAVLGAYFTDRLGRRRQIMVGSAAFAITFSIITALAATNTANDSSGTYARSPDSSKAFIAMILIFGLFFCFFFTPIQNLYILESLHFQVRAKAFGLVAFCYIPIGFYNDFVTNIALSNIEWKYYFVFVTWNIFVVVAVYFLFVETSGRTLEELTDIFRSQYPVKTSLSKSKIIVEGEEIIFHETERLL